MKVCGVLFTSLLACCVTAENFNLLVPVARHLSSKVKRQTTGGDPNLENIFGQQSSNSNFGNGQFPSGNSESTQFGFGSSGLNEGSSNNNGGFGGFNSNQNQGSSSNGGGGGGGGFNNFGTGGFDSQGSNSGGFNNFGNTPSQGGFGNQGSNQWSSGFGSNGGFSNGQGSSFGNGQNGQGFQRPRTTQRTPINVISMQTTIDNTECSRQCRIRATQQYNPVCGSDNITYANQQTFNCYQRECRRDVTVRYSGSCVTTPVPTSSTTPNH